MGDGRSSYIPVLHCCYLLSQAFFDDTQPRSNTGYTALSIMHFFVDLNIRIA